MSEIKTGRYFDALVAKKVMGWKFMGEFTLDPELNCDRWAYDENQNEKYYSDVPKYSTDISDAWRLVEKIHSGARGIIQLVGPQQDYINEKWRCLFSGKHWETSHPYSWETEAQTAPLAICLAALEFINKQNNEG